jgi:rod shape-determining protein MreD
MRWISFFILAYVAVGVQMGMGEFVRVHGATPSIAVMAVVFIASNARRDEALLASFVIGARQDLTTLAPLGLYALSYSLVGLFVVSMHEVLSADHPVTHFLLCFVASLIMGAVIYLHGVIRGPAVPMGGLFSAAIYTAILAPIVLGALSRMKKLFAFSRRRTRTA